MKKIAVLLFSIFMGLSAFAQSTPGPQTICVGNTEPYRVTLTPNSDYTWAVLDDTNTEVGAPLTITGQGSNEISIVWNVTPGTYTLQVIEETEDGCEGDPRTKVVTVVPNNTITLTSAAGTDDQTVCLDDAITEITYNTTGATGATITGLPDGVTGNFAGNTVTISGTPTETGSFEYTIALTGGCGTVSTTGDIEVTPINTIALTSAAGTDDQTVCLDDAITQINYNTTGATGATITGLPAGVTGFFAGNTVTISGTPTETGSFEYTIALTGGCGTVSTTGDIEVTPINTIALTSAVGTDDQTVCLDAAITEITYNTTGATGATITGLPDGVTGNFAGNTVTISGTPTETGSFEYTIALTGGCGTVSTTGDIEVTPINTIALTSAAGTDDQTVCLDDAITQINYNTTGATGATITGLPAGVTGFFAGNTVTISGTPTETGSFEYIITLTGGCGTVSTTGDIDVTPINTIALTSAAGTDDQTVCLDAAITEITYNTTGATGATITGLPAGVIGNFAGNTVTISGTPTETGSFEYTITLTGGCGTVSTTGDIEVTPLPSVIADSNSPTCVGDDLTLFSEPNGGTNYSWTGPGGYTASVQNPIRENATGLMAGDYTVIVTVSGCTNTATTTVVINPAPVTSDIFHD
jgi:uncharacterized protein YceK